jgi:hypothetical protein
MDWYLLRQRLFAEHSQDQQRVARLERAISLAEEALRDLAALGHQFHLAPGAQPRQSAWPRRVFHISCPAGRLVHSQFDIVELGEDWFDTLLEAHHSHGLRTQFAGRGGVTIGGLPAVVPEAPEASIRPKFNDADVPR